jgi:hypothetical protein
MAPLFVNIVLLILCLFYSLFFGLVNDSIAQQKALKLQNEFLEYHRDDSIPHGA